MLGSSLLSDIALDHYHSLNDRFAISRLIQTSHKFSAVTISACANR